MIGHHLQVTIGRAADYAREAGHELVTLEHLLLALTHDPEAREALLAVGVDVERLREDLQALLAEFEAVQPNEAAPRSANNESSLHMCRVLSRCSRQRASISVASLSCSNALWPHGLGAIS